MATLTDLEKRVELLERILMRIVQVELRLDTLEFNSDKPTNPGISQAFMNMKNRLETLEHIIIGETHVRD